MGKVLIADYGAGVDAPPVPVLDDASPHKWGMFRNAQDRNAPRCPLDREYICASGRMDIRLSTRYVSLCHTHSAYRRGHTSRLCGRLETL